jgi:ubiquinone/menaquinone biosynthesis C-methylase UbiE
MNHDELYRHARFYDVAFSYRDFAAEVDFLSACAKRFGLGEPKSFLEVAAGPGAHALVAAERGMRSVALDLAPAMMELCAAKAKAARVEVQTMVADMARFDVEVPVELAFNPLTSISYLRSIDALVEHMKCMARALVPGGVYVVENNHPRDFVHREHFVPSQWTTRDGSLTVATTWIAEAPPKFDVSHQLYEAVGRYLVDDDGVRVSIEDRAWLRMTFPGEIALAAKLAGLDVVAELGDLDVDKPLTDGGWRAVTVLAKPA